MNMASTSVLREHHITAWRKRSFDEVTQTISDTFVEPSPPSGDFVMSKKACVEIPTTSTGNAFDPRTDPRLAVPAPRPPLLRTVSFPCFEVPSCATTTTEEIVDTVIKQELIDIVYEIVDTVTSKMSPKDNIATLTPAPKEKMGMLTLPPQMMQKEIISALTLRTVCSPRLRL